MALNGAQRAQIQKALLAAFDEADLRQLVAHELDADLDAVAGGDNTAELVFNLIKWADQTGCVRKLIDGALRQNPGNPELQALAHAAPKWQLDAPAAVPAPAPALPPTRAQDQAKEPPPVPSQPAGLNRAAGVWIAAGLALAALLLALVFWPRPPPPATAQPPTATPTPADTSAATPLAAATPSPAVVAPAATPAAPPTPTSTPQPLAVAIEPFANCAEPNPATALHAQLQDQLLNAGAAVQLTLLETAVPAVGAVSPDIVLGGSCTAAGQVVYTADLRLVGDGRGERVAEPTRLELPWPAAASPTKTLAALLIYHAQEGSLLPVALLNQEAAWDKVPGDGRLTLHWLMGNALLDHPGRMEERAREHYQQSLSLTSAPPAGERIAAELYNNRGWAYYRQAREYARQSGAETELARTYYLSATQEFSRAVELDGSYGMAWVNLGEAYTGLRNHAQAHESCDQAILRSDHFAPAFICKAKAHYFAVELPQAIEQAQLALANNEQYALAHYLAGLSYCYLEEAEQAAASLRWFLEWRPLLSRWDKYAPSLAEAQRILQGIDNNTMCQW